MVAKRRSNGEGSFHLDPRGRWVGRAYAPRPDGTIQRIYVYASTRAAARDRLMHRLTELNKTGRRNRTWTVGDYLDHWFTTVVETSCKDRTQEFYESAIRLYLKPALGTIKLAELSVHDVQRAINGIRSAGGGVRTLQKVRQTIRTALNQAEREELVSRNVARLVVLPRYVKQPIRPWTVEQQRTFMSAARGHPWYAAFALLVLYGLRRGEVLGLRLCDVDLDGGLLHVRQQLQRISGKGLTVGSVKTSAGHRVLPLTQTARAELAAYMGGDQEPDDLIFRSSAGTPVDPKNFVRTFHEIRAAAGLPRITVHHLRHSAATTMKNFGAAAADAQSILGHAHVSTTMQIYTHSDGSAQLTVLDRVSEALVGPIGVQNGCPDLASRVPTERVTPVVDAEMA